MFFNVHVIYPSSQHYKYSIQLWDHYHKLTDILRGIIMPES